MIMLATVTDTVTVEWRPIPGAERYLVSRDGHVKGPSGRLLKLWGSGGRSGQEYPAFHVSLGRNRCRKKMFVHIAVALAFLGPRPEDAPLVDHVNRTRHDPRVDNLRWASFTENRLNSSDIVGSARQAGDIF